MYDSPKLLWILTFVRITDMGRMLQCSTRSANGSPFALDPVQFRVAIPAADPPDNATTPLK